MHGRKRPHADALSYDRRPRCQGSQRTAAGRTSDPGTHRRRACGCCRPGHPAGFRRPSAEGIPVQQHGHGLQGALLIAAKDIIQILKTRKRFSFHLFRSIQADLVFADEDDPAGLSSKSYSICALSSSSIGWRRSCSSGERRHKARPQISSHGHIAQDIGGIGFIVIGDDQISAVRRRSQDRPEQRCSIVLADLQRYRHFADIWDFFQFRLCGNRIIAQSTQQIPAISVTASA